MGGFGADGAWGEGGFEGVKLAGGAWTNRALPPEPLAAASPRSGRPTPRPPPAAAAPAAAWKQTGLRTCAAQNRAAGLPGPPLRGGGQAPSIGS